MTCFPAIFQSKEGTHRRRRAPKKKKKKNLGPHIEQKEIVASLRKGPREGKRGPDLAPRWGKKEKQKKNQKKGERRGVSSILRQGGALVQNQRGLKEKEDLLRSWVQSNLTQKRKKASPDKERRPSAAPIPEVMVERGWVVCLQRTIKEGRNLP